MTTLKDILTPEHVGRRFRFGQVLSRLQVERALTIDYTGLNSVEITPAEVIETTVEEQA